MEDTLWKSIPYMPCLFHEVTGYYCPGCGGTRAVLALLQGHPLRSLYYHPIVLYSLLCLFILVFLFIIFLFNYYGMRGMFASRKLIFIKFTFINLKFLQNTIVFMSIGAILILVIHCILKNIGLTL